MKKVIISIVAITIVLTAYFINEKNYSVEYLDDGKLGVETLVERSVDLEDMIFTCSAVFQIEEVPEEGKYYINEVSAEFIQRKKAPNWYTFSFKDDVKVIEVNPGICYELRQEFIVSRNGNKIGTVDVGAQFSVNTATGEMSAQDVFIP